MKRFLLVFLLTALPVSASAVSYQVGDTVEVKAEENAYAAGNIVQLSSPAKGDVYLAGETVQINAEIAKDAVIVGKTITINETINEDLHAFGATIIINKDIRGDAILFGQNIVIAPDAHIYGSTIIGGEDIRANGRFDRDVRLMGAKVAAKGKFLSDVIIHAGKSLTFNENTEVQGNLLLTVPESVGIVIPENAVRGQVQKELFTNRMTGTPLKIFAGLALFSFLSRILLGGLIIALARIFAMHYGTDIHTKFWKLFAVGFLGLLAPPVMAMMLFLPVITIPLAILILVIWGTLLYLASLFTGLLVANLIFPLQNDDSVFLMIGKFALGTLIFSLIKVIPFIGFLVATVFFILSIGSVISYEAKSLKALRKAKLL